MLAGGSIPIPMPLPVPQPMVQIANLKVPTLDILPGGTGKVLAGFALKTMGHQYGRLEEMILLPAQGSEPLSWNASNFVLRADLNNKASDGCEAVIGTGQVDYQTDVLDIMVTRPVWTRSNALNLQLTADFSGGQFSGDTIGVELAWAGFRDLRNQGVPDSNISYTGVDPVLHTMETAYLGVSQQQMLPFGSAFAGDKNVALLKFYAWNNSAVTETVSFTASQGNLLNAGNYTLFADTNNDGNFDTSVPGYIMTSTSYKSKTVSVTTSSLVFNLNPGMQVQGCNFEVCADIAVTPVSGVLQLAFAPGVSVTGHDANTGKALKGFRLNGNGEGQISLYAQTSLATAYNLVTRPEELVVKEFGSTTTNGIPFSTAKPGDNIVVDAGTMYAPLGNITVSHMAIIALNGDLNNLVNYTLWVDTNGDRNVDTNLGKGALVNSQVSFDNFQEKVPAGQSVMFEVHADVPNPLVGSYIQCQFAGAGGITAKRDNGTLLTLDKVFAQCAMEPAWNLQVGGGGVGVDALLAQIAALQAQLAALQGGGLG
jgi:hypothetical protein